MTFLVELPLSAAAELQGAFDHIHSNSPVAAERWRAELLKLIASLGSMPRRYPVAREQHRATYELRQVVIRVHRILYTVDVKKVIVLHVRHASMDDMTSEELGR